MHSGERILQPHKGEGRSVTPNSVDVHEVTYTLAASPDAPLLAEGIREGDQTCALSWLC
jgi:hypothetical protein